MARNRSQLSRRDLLKLSSAGAFGVSVSPWLRAFADQTAKDPKRKRACILLWMTGGPSQTDTFDMKPDHENGGEFKPIKTNASGVEISEHLPRLAGMMDHIVPIRSMTTKEGDHSRGTYVMRTGYPSSGPVQYPTMGSLLSKELAFQGSELPDYVSVAPYKFLNPAAYAPGFLGPKHAPLVVGGQNGIGNTAYNENSLKVRNLDAPNQIDLTRADARLDLLAGLEEDFSGTHPGVSTESHRAAYDQAVKMMRSEAVKAFNLEEEPDALRDKYGRNLFGQGCLLARRLVERGVPFVEVSLNGAPGLNTFGWDTHTNNFPALKQLLGVMDPGWATLMSDLKDRGFLDSTLIVWMGEFGRTPKINGNKGRDHFPNAWTTVLAGGGIRGGQAIGRTSKDGMTVEDRPVSHADLMATICKALGLDPMKQNMSNVGRPIRLANPEANPIDEVLS